MVDLTRATRESVMDGEPWTYALMARELAAEGKLTPWSTRPLDADVIHDPREYVYLEAHLSLQHATVAAEVTLDDGRTVTSRWWEERFADRPERLGQDGGASRSRACRRSGMVVRAAAGSFTAGRCAGTRHLPRRGNAGFQNRGRSHRWRGAHHGRSCNNTDRRRNAQDSDVPIEKIAASESSRAAHARSYGVARPGCARQRCRPRLPAVARPLYARPRSVDGDCESDGRPARPDRTGCPALRWVTCRSVRIAVHRSSGSLAAACSDVNDGRNTALTGPCVWRRLPGDNRGPQVAQVDGQNRVRDGSRCP